MNKNGLNINRRNIITYIIYCITVSLIISNSFSTRQFNNGTFSTAINTDAPFISLFRLLSVASLIFIATLYIISTINQRKGFNKQSWSIGFPAIIFIIPPLIFSPLFSITHGFDYHSFYGTMLILVLMRLDGNDSGWFLKLSRNSVGLFLFVCILSLAVPGISIEQNYSGDLLVPLPIRFHGVASLGNHLAALACLFILLDILRIELHSHKTSLWNIFSWAIAVGILGMTQSKTTFFAFISGLAIYSVLKFRTPWFVKFFVATLAVAFMVLFLQSSNTVLEINNETATLTGRTQVWDYVISLYNENKFFGYGTELWLDDTRTNFFTQYGWAPGQSHNQWVQTLGRSGWLGMFGMIIYALSIILASRIVYVKGGKVIFVIAWVFFVRSVTESSWMINLFSENYMYQIIFLGVLISSVQDNHTNSKIEKTGVV
ncbi:O-antigen ligase family protein [Deinococcus aquatilis]|uniref:O-antigen ligase family protein n=1 Tax=Deinococcus aquatilis TaxID=519440 RepID=UPI0003A1FD78|nr:O-antigen ligase family protein [Deinococcus aquatilis]